MIKNKNIKNLLNNQKNELTNILNVFLLQRNINLTGDDMGFSQAIASCMGKYANFQGRATRGEYWWFYLFQILLTWGASIVGSLTLGDSGYMLTGLVSLALLLPSIAVGARRLHDTGRSGWWQLLAFTIIGIILLIVWFVSDGEKDANKYGEPISS